MKKVTKKLKIYLIITKIETKYKEMIKNHDIEINNFNNEIQELKEQNNDLKQN